MLSTRSRAGVDFSKMPDSETVRILRADAEYDIALVLDSRDTFISGVLGQRFGDACFACVAQYKIAYTCFIAWLIGVRCIIPTLFGWLPKGMAWAGLLWVPSPMLALAFSNRYLLRKLFWTFEVWYLLAQLTVWAVLAAGIVQGDSRVVIILGVWWCCLATTVADAFHPSVQRAPIFFSLLHGTQ